METILIAIIIAIFAVSAFIGVKKGFLRTIVGMSLLLISIALVAIFSPMVTDYIIKKTPFRQSVYESIDAKLTEMAEEKAAKTTEEIRGVMEESFIPSIIIKSFDDKISSRIQPMEYLHNASMYTATKVAEALGILVTLLLAFVVLRLIVMLTGLVSKIPVVSGANRILGLGLGLVRGLILVWILCYVITIFSFTDIGQKSMQAMTDNSFLSLFYNGALSIGKLI